jgi:hypothetical protein
MVELYLYVKVMKNTYPDFVTEIETMFTLTVGKNLTYKLPALRDEEGNDEPELLIKPMDDQEYPPFLDYEPSTTSLIFTPHSIWYQGKTYYFKIIVKEKHSDTQQYPYYCTVKVIGDQIDPEQYLNFTNVKLSMGGVDRAGQGNFSFTSPVNLTFVKEHFWELFDVYVRNVSFKELNRTMNVKDFKITDL